MNFSNTNQNLEAEKKASEKNVRQKKESVIHSKSSDF